MKDIRKYISIVLAVVACCRMHAQNFPVGIVSTQDSVKNVQLGVFSSIAPEGGHGVQMSGVSSISAHRFNGLSTGCNWVV